jgi:hypothetical protein
MSASNEESGEETLEMFFDSFSPRLFMDNKNLVSRNRLQSLYGTTWP